jgi:hypothetical protein
MHGQNFRCDRPPSADDWLTDLKGELAIYLQQHAYIPDYALSFMATAALRALFLEHLLATIYRCTSIRACKPRSNSPGSPGSTPPFPSRSPPNELHGRAASDAADC